MININQGLFLNEETNNVTLVGRISNTFTFSHEIHGESFYLSEIKTTRQSLVEDIIPFMISDHLVNFTNLDNNKKYKIQGQIRTYNQHTNEKTKLLIFVFVKDIIEVEEEYEDINEVYINGFTCKSPIYRKTPNGREISDLVVAVNRAYGKSDYLPCICWGRNARYSRLFHVGTRIKLTGRIQSRQYDKHMDDTTVTKVAYEVSVSSIQIT